MNKKQSVLNYVKTKYGTTPDYPFHYFPDYAALRHGVDGAWYALLLSVPREKLGLTGNGRIDILDLKCRPEDIHALRTTDGILPAYHMNKSHWITVLADGTVSDTLITDLIDGSYNLTR